MPHKQPATAEEALQERDRLLRAYRRARNEYREQLFARPGGEMLQEFARQLHRYGRRDATAMLAYVREQARGWLATVEPQIRVEALSLINERIIAIRQRAGMVPFDDPINPANDENDVWQQCKRELA